MTGPAGRGDAAADTARGEGGARGAASVRRAPFGATPDGTPVEQFVLTTRSGAELRAITFGGIITALRVPDRDGVLDDVVLGHDDVAGYVRSAAYLGAIVGRYGNRIAHGRFTLDGVTHQLAVNDGPHHLHGGPRGFDRVVWRGTPFESATGVGVAFEHTSPAGDQGYPGTLEARVTYTLTERHELVVDYHATTDAPTPVNLTQHSYFNLSGSARRDVLGHELTIRAGAYTPVDATLIPTGAIAPVAGTPFDFRRPTPIGAHIDADDAQLRHGRGYDHNFVLDRQDGVLAPAARLEDPVSGRTLDIATTEPGLQLYSGNFLDGTVAGKGGRPLAHRSGVCLETQHFPDSPNNPHFPPVVLRPGATHHSRTIFTFGTRAAGAR